VVRVPEGEAIGVRELEFRDHGELERVGGRKSHLRSPGLRELVYRQRKDSTRIGRGASTAKDTDREKVGKHQRPQKPRRHDDRTGWCLCESSRIGASVQVAILLRRQTGCHSGAKVLVEVTDVRPVSAHRCEIGFPPIALDAGEEVYVAVAFPPSDGVAGPGVGAGIGAKVLEADVPRDCYFAADREGRLGVMDVDYEIELVFVGMGETNAAERGTETAPLVADARVRPNPFNHSVTIELKVPHPAPVEIAVHDAAGRLVRLLLSERRTQGVHEVVWDGRDQQGRRVASGLYLAKVRIGDRVVSRKLALAK
jgi:hypothetical protein